MDTDTDDTAPRSTAAEVLREILRTPVIIDLLRVNLRGPWEVHGHQVARTLVEEDAELGLALASSAPRSLNALVQALLEVGRALDRFPPELVRAYGEQLVGDLDHEALHELARVYGRLLHRTLWADQEGRAQLLKRLASATNGLLALLIEAHEKNPTAIFSPVREVAAHLADELDFGLARQAIEAVAESATEADLLQDLLDQTLGDPVLLANVLEILPPLLNAQLEVTVRALSAIELPSEVLASGVFNLIGEIDTARAGALVNGICETIQSLHKGSLLLGRHEPRFRSVLTKFLGDLLSNLDRDRAAGAVSALAEDAQTVLQSLGDLLFRDPRLLTRSVATTLGSMETVQRGAADAIERLGQLPDDAVDQLADELEQNLDPRAAASLLNATMRLLERVLEKRPDLPRLLFERFWSTLDRQRATWILKRLVGRSLTAEGLGSMLATAINSNPQLVIETISRTISDLDPVVLSKTVEAILSALSRRPDLVQALARPLIAGLPRLLGDLLASSWPFSRNTL